VIFHLRGGQMHQINFSARRHQYKHKMYWLQKHWVLFVWLLQHLMWKNMKIKWNQSHIELHDFSKQDNTYKIIKHEYSPKYITKASFS